MHGRHTERESLALHPSLRQQMMERAPHPPPLVNSRVKKGVQASLSQHTLFGSAGSNDDLVSFVTIECFQAQLSDVCALDQFPEH